MGCKFGGDQKEEEQNEINNLEEEDQQKETIRNLDYYMEKFDSDEKKKIEEMVEESNNYSQKMLQIFNEIRQNPNDYANYIEDSMDYIVETPKKNSPDKDIVFERHLRIRLVKGEPAFRDAARSLKSLVPLEPLIYKKDLCVPLPTSAYDISNKQYLQNQINYIKSNRRVDAYFKSNINIPELSALMLIVDDIGANSGKRKDIILRKDIKYVGISAGNVGGSFVAYFAFSR